MPQGVELVHSRRTELPGSTVVGTVPDDEPMSASISIRQNPERRQRSESAGGDRDTTHLSNQEFTAIYGADEAEVEAVSGVMRRLGFTVDDASAPRRTVRISGTARQFQDVFETTLQRYEYEGRTFRGRTGSLYVPTEVAELVDGVFGIDNRPIAKRHTTTESPAAPRVSGGNQLTVAQVATAYDFPTMVNGSGQTIAIVEFGGGYVASDLSTFFSGAGVTAPTVTCVGVDGATNSPVPAGATDDPDAEVALDIEVVGAVAPGAAIVVYFAPNSSDGWRDVAQTILNDTANNPSVVSISWGGAEDSSVWTPQLIQQLEGSFTAAAAKGISVFAASGDNGSSDGVPGDLAHVDYPASSANVTGCGGSVLTLSGSTIGSEVAWNNPSAGTGAADGTSGGGVSTRFPLPAWQNGVGVPDNASGGPGRGVPDVCGHADSYLITLRGAPVPVGGTSAVAPLWAGLAALINQQMGSRVGAYNSKIYSSAVSSTFNDITSGINGAYSAGPGWDPCTGLGSPNGSKLTTALGQAPTPTSTPQPPAPIVTGVSPSSGLAAGGDTVTVSGSGFTGAIDVGFGSTNAGSMTVVSDSEVTVTSPAGTGTVDVTVTTPAGTSSTSAADQFTYGTTAQPPAISGVSPTTGAAGGGDEVTVTGSGFTGTTSVLFGSVPGTNLVVVSDSQLTVTSPVPNASGTVDITVTTPSGTSATSAADQFTYASS